MTTSTGTERIHAFGDDALGDLDAVGVAAAIRAGDRSAREILTAAIARTEQVNAALNAVEVEDFQRALDTVRERPGGPLGGVPTLIKDNNPVAGLPTGNGTASYVGTPAAKDGVFVGLLKRQGLVPMGKTRLPEFGFNASTEYAEAAPTRNPWSLGHSSGGSSGGAAALVAAGAVPIAHGNDGGGSIRIPAACCGLVGLKPTRGRLVCDPADDQLPVRIISEGVLSRSVRDTAAFLGSAELYRPNLSLPPIGRVVAPVDRPLRIGLVVDSITGHPTDAATRNAVADTAGLLEDLGHQVSPMPLPATQQFADDFVLYWGMLALVVQTTGRRAISPTFDRSKLDNLTKGMAAQCRAGLRRLPSAIYRLRRSARDFAAVFTSYDVVLSPVLGHTTPELGYLNPDQPFDQMLERLVNYVSFTPLNNASGTPAMSLPLGQTPDGIPIGVHFSAAHGDERTLLELALQLEQARPWLRIQDR